METKKLFGRVFLATVFVAAYVGMVGAQRRYIGDPSLTITDRARSGYGSRRASGLHGPHRQPRRGGAPRRPGVDHTSSGHGYRLRVAE